MSITYSWQVTNMNTKNDGDLENAVIKVYWLKTGVDEDGVEGSCMGESTFNMAEISPEEFVPYEDLTEEIVLGWVQSTINEAYHEGIDEQIQNVINEKKNPVMSPGLPWVPAPTP